MLHDKPLPPHALGAVPGWQAPVASQQPVQLAAEHASGVAVKQPETSSSNTVREKARIAHT